VECTANMDACCIAALARARFRPQSRTNRKLLRSKRESATQTQKTHCTPRRSALQWQVNSCTTGYCSERGNVRLERKEEDRVGHVKGQTRLLTVLPSFCCTVEQTTAFRTHSTDKCKTGNGYSKDLVMHCTAVSREKWNGFSARKPDIR
jgi:hypothetical protein